MSKSKLIILQIFCSVFLFQNIIAQEIDRIEPPFWWSDMKNDLQLMVYGKDLKGADVKSLNKGLTVTAIHDAENPNYLFVDVDVKKPGKYTLEITKGNKSVQVTYEILSRVENSANRQGFNSSDAIYLIMPDRFANGDTTNDIIEGSDQILNRKDMSLRHGGDIQGIIDHLDYLSDLGITAIWSTPMQEDTRYYHQYGVTDYYKIDPHLGTNRLYKEYVTQAHKKGLRVIQDITPNHCGIDHWWMKDMPFHDWINPKMMDGNFWIRFSLESQSDPHASAKDSKFCESNWLYDTMPDNNLSNPFVLKYLSQMAIWWIEYAGIDGLRVDTYFYMGKKSAEWTKAILDEYPNFTLVGEVWGTDPAIVSYWVGSTENPDGFSSHLPMVMDFPLQAAIATELAGKGTHWGGAMRDIYRVIAMDFLYKKPEKSQVIFADNHDTDRLYNTLGKDLNATKMAITLITTTRGLPQFFYGTELLFQDKKNGGAHRARPDFPGGWSKDTINLFNAKDRSREQQEMFNHTRKLLNFRKQHSLFYDGKLMHYIPIDGVYTYFRYNEEECLMVALNASDTDKSVDWERFDERLNDKTKGISILDNKTINKGEDIKIPPHSSLVIYFQ
ncbi:MAG: alpha-amylase family glycosyl hydrolase [Paludibacter sp.]